MCMCIVCVYTLIHTAYTLPFIKGDKKEKEKLYHTIELIQTLYIVFHIYIPFLEGKTSILMAIFIDTVEKKRSYHPLSLSASLVHQNEQI